MKPELAERLTRARFDVETSAEAGLSGWGASDDVQLAHAATSGRVLLTHDRKTFPAAVQRWRDAGQSHAGVVLCQDESVAQLFERVLALFGSYDAERLRDAIVWLPPPLSG